MLPPGVAAARSNEVSAARDIADSGAARRYHARPLAASAACRVARRRGRRAGMAIGSRRGLGRVLVSGGCTLLLGCGALEGARLYREGTEALERGDAEHAVRALE